MDPLQSCAHFLATPRVLEELISDSTNATVSAVNCALYNFDIIIILPCPTTVKQPYIAEDFGFDLSSVTRAFYRQIVRERRIPLNLSYSQPNAESAESIWEAEQIIVKGGTGRFQNAEEILADLGI